MLDEAERQYVPGAGPDLRPAGARKAGLWIAQGRTHDALAWAVERNVSARDELSYPREREVLRLAAAGLSNREIADRLFLALTTVNCHNRNIFGKFGAQCRTEAIARARETGVL
jgi:ATP/maltotriose-dependent transcriptional regulator MalT